MGLKQQIYQSEGGRYPITEPVSVLSPIYGAGQQAEPHHNTHR